MPYEHLIAQAKRYLSDREIRTVLASHGASGLRRYVGKQSYTAFLYVYFGDTFTSPFSTTHTDLFTDLDTVAARLRTGQSGVKHVYALPRGFGKSTFVTRIFPVYCFLYNISPLTVLIANNQLAAGRLTKNITSLLATHPLLKEDFPNLKGQQWGIERIDNAEGSSIVAFGMGSGALRGMTNQSRPTLILLDDVDDDASVRSAVALSHAREFFDKTVLYLGDTITHRTSFLMIGTVIRKTSLLQYVLEGLDFTAHTARMIQTFATNAPLWEAWQTQMRQLAAVNAVPQSPEEDTFYQAHKPAMLEGTEVLWDLPDTYYRAMVARLRNEAAFWAELQNAPRDTGGVLGVPTITKLPLDDTEYDLLAWLDPTTSGGKHADFAAWVEVLYHRRTRQMVVTYVDAAQRTYPQTIDAVAARVLHRGRQYQGMWVEANSAGIVIRDMLTQRITPYSPVAYHNTLPKAERIELVGLYMQQGQLTFADTLDTGIFQEIDSFPFGQHDDRLDALAGIVYYLHSHDMLTVYPTQRTLCY